MFKKFLVIVWILGFVVLKGENMQVQFSFGGSKIIVLMENNVAAKDFLARLPLDLKFSDFMQKEKIASLSKRLNVGGLNDVLDPQIGDFFYYKPWGNIGIFYGKQPASSDLVLLGRLQNLQDLEKLKAQSSDFSVKIELLQNTH